MASLSEASVTQKKVCIVGGGPAGLVSLRRVLDSPKLTGTIFEQKNDIGGLWNYQGQKVFATSPNNLDASKSPMEDPENVTTMYDNLSCNLPYKLMEFREFEHPRDRYTFASQKQMHEYLQGYATHFNLWPNIKVNTTVVNIQPENATGKDGESVKWIVHTHNHVDDVHTRDIYDAVIICTGKNSYDYPAKSPIEGLDSFKGKVMHCKYFKTAEGFEGKNVVLIGLGPSAGDIALMVSKVAKTVTVCHKFPYGFSLGLLPSNAREVKNVKHIVESGVVSEDDEVVPADAIILCTGYGLKYPFLSPECGVTVLKDKYIPHLYKMTIFTKHPTLAILNMCYRCPEYLIIELQARFFVSYLEGKTHITYDDMEAAVKKEEEEKEKEGIPMNLWFQIGNFGRQSWKYFMKIAEEIGVADDYPDQVLLEHLYNTIVLRIFGALALYKADKLNIVSKNSWELILHSSTEFPDSKAAKLTMSVNPDLSLTTETTELDGPAA